MMERVLRHLRDERGTTLVEVIVAAVVLVVISGAITSMLNGATSASGQQRIQAVAADLGQATLEEWRTMPFTRLQNLDVTQDGVDAGGHTFQVHTESEWAMENQPGAQGCSSAGRSPEALRLSTTVRWNGMKRRPVQLDTLVAAPAGASAHHGTFVEQITDRDGYGVDGVLVTISGGPSGSVSGSTDTNGCVRFSDILEGRYLMSFSKSGYVTPAGLTGVSGAEIDVKAGESRSRSDEYDAAGTARVRFVRGDTRAVVDGSNGQVFGAVFDSPLMSRSQTGAASGAQNRYDQGGLYPNTAEYAVYPDTCKLGRPSTDGVRAPQGGQSAITDIAVPVLRVVVDNAPNTGINSQPKQFQLRTMTACGSRHEQSDWTSRGTNSNNADVTLPYTVVPGGQTTKVCVVYRYTESVWGSNQQRYGTKTMTVDVNGNVVSRTLPSGGWTTGLTSDPTSCPS